MSNQSESSSCGRPSIVDEAMRWVRENEGTKIDPCKGSYPSPRISSELMDCSMPLTFDQYSFCGLGCLYCFAYFFKSQNPSMKGKMGVKAVDIDALIKTMESKIKQGRTASAMQKHFYNKKFLFHWGGLADPFCSFEKENKEGLKLIKWLGENNYPTLFSFKGGTVLAKPYMELWQKYSKQRNFAFQFSIVTADDATAANVEVGVPSPTSRFKVMKTLSDMGYWTILRLRPFLIGITDRTLDEILEKSFEAGARGISTEFFAMDCRMTDGMKTRYNYLAKEMGLKDFDGLEDYFRKLSPTERGGYRRLNRDVKERHIKKLYQFAVKHNMVLGISDPDFKELNMSGSCCAMPDKFPDNPLLENWSRNQLTYHLTQMRKHYHKTGECRTLTFTQCYGINTFMDETSLANDHVAVIGVSNAVRQRSTLRDIIRQRWNNLDSAANPRNYFHGKLMPAGMDNEGNMIFKYTPSSYEDRWTAEGIDLTK